MLSMIAVLQFSVSFCANLCVAHEGNPDAAPHDDDDDSTRVSMKTTHAGVPSQVMKEEEGKKLLFGVQE